MTKVSIVNTQHNFFTLGIAVLIVGSLFFARVLLQPLVAAILLTFILSPAVTFLHHKGLGRVPSVIVVVGMVFLLLGGLFFLFFVQFKELAGNSQEYKTRIIEKINSIRHAGKGTWLDDFVSSIQDIGDNFQKTAPQSKDGQDPVPVKIENSYFPLLQSITGSALETLVNCGLVLLLVIFMMIQREDFRNRMIRLWGHGNLTTTTRAIDDASQRISDYLLMQVIINSCYGLALGFGLWMIGVPFYFIWGVLGAILRYVPYLGPWMGAFFPVVTSLAVLPEWSSVLLILGYIFVLEMVISNVMEPWLYGKTTGISMLALLIAASFWTWIWGPVGLLLATPITTCLVVMGRHIPSLEFLNLLLGDEPPLIIHVAFFQRLLARDQDEAADLVEDFLKSHPINSVYDEVLLPALARAKNDRDLENLSPEDHQQVIQCAREVFRDVVIPEQDSYWIAEGEEATEKLTGERIHVLGIPGGDEADEFALEIFKEFVNPSKCRFQVVSHNILQGEVSQLIIEEEPAIVFIGVLLGRRLAHTRYLCKRIRAQYPNLKILIGCWALDDKVEPPQTKLLEIGANDIGTTFQESRDQIQTLLALVQGQGQPIKS